MPHAGDIIVTDFPGVTGMKRRPAVVLSSATYHASRPDVILGLITSQMSDANTPSDCVVQDWTAAGLRVPSAFRTFLVTLPASTISARIGRLSNRDWHAVHACVETSLATKSSKKP